MQQFLMASKEERQQQLKIATTRSGIPQHLLEHDWWQSFVLKALFEIPSAEYLTLHGSRSVRNH
ncbi:hypothetical protein [Arachidicoccus rhizosphaerae]|nr:hypothetical protein [Arachidicoccus rhizosphaerae]